MKPLKLLILSLLFPLIFHAQKTLTGLWIGSLSNDSTTIRKDQSFEVALTEYKGKVYGYSRSTFIVNDTLYYILKRVKGTIDGEVCEVKDDEIISYNFRGRIDKGIKVTTIFRRNLLDSVWHLAGDWKTNQTKRYYSISGKVELKEETDYTKSKIFPHLEELNIDKEVEFYVAAKKTEPNYQDSRSASTIKKDAGQPADLASTTLKKSSAPASSVPGQNRPIDTDVAKPEPPAVKTNELVVSEPTVEEALAATTLKKSNTQASSVAGQNRPIDKEVAKPEIKNQPPTVKINEPVVPEPTVEEALAATTLKKSNTQASSVAGQNRPIDKEVAKPEIKNQRPAVKINEPVVPEKTVEESLAATTLKKSNTQASTVAGQNKSIDNGIAKPEIKNQAPTVKINEPSAPENKKVDPASMAKLESGKTIANATVQTSIKTPTAATLIAERKLAAAQVVEFKSDSLVIKLYDNGEIDGDTVSVLLNGEMLMAKQGLKASAIRQTIYIQPGQDEMTLVLYAENLGKYPPNTGLLVINDGDETYQLRFSADLQQNAAVVFRRKK